MPMISFSGRVGSAFYKLKQFFSLTLCMVVALQPMMVELAHAQEIIIDPSGNVGFSPSMQRTSRPQVVDIARPNDGGVSHNKFTKFDVGNEGAVLNNSKTATSTKVAGAIAGNPNLTGSTASTIVNEVTSTSDSTLTGAVEVAGDKAGVIIANPNGITCNGCSFINANQGTLTTGVPVVEGSSVRLDVTQGTVTIGRRGLNGAAGSPGAISDFNLIGRTVVIDGKVTAINGINIQGGAQSYDLSNQRRVSTLKGAGTAASDLVVDGTEFGAMEAGRIQIIGNERGLGVRTLGAVQSSKEGVSIVSEGSTTVRSVAAKGRAELRANRGTLTIERDVSSAEADTLAFARHIVKTTSRTGIYGKTGVVITARKNVLSFSGVLQSGADVKLYGGKLLSFSAYGTAVGDFVVSSKKNVKIEDATIVAKRVVANQSLSFTLKESAVFSAEDFKIATGDFYLGHNVIVKGASKDKQSNLVVTASGSFHNSANLQHHRSSTFDYAGNLYNEVGGVISEDNLSIAFNGEVHNSGTIYGVKALTLDVTALINNKTGVILSDVIDIKTKGLLRNSGAISSDGNINLTSGTKIVNEGNLRGIRAQLTAPEIKNGGGADLRVRDFGRILATTDFVNVGIVASTGSFEIKGGRFENKGLVSVETSLSAVTQTIVNTNVLTAGSVIDLRATRDLTNLGTVVSYDNASLSSDTVVLNQGTILADGRLSVAGPLFENRGVKALFRAKIGDIRSSKIRNSGRVFLIDKFRRRGNIDHFENDGVFASQGSIEIRGRDENSRILLNAGSSLISGLKPDDKSQELMLGSSISLVAAGELKLDGRIVAGGTIGLLRHGGLILNGAVEARQNLNLTGDTVAVSSAAKVQAVGDATIAAKTKFSNSGKFLIGGTINAGMGTGDFSNSGLLSARATYKFRIQGDFTNTGIFQTSAGSSITAASIKNDGHIQSGGNLSLNAATSSISEYFTANKKRKLAWVTTGHGDISGNGSISIAGSGDLTGRNVSFGEQSYFTSAQLKIHSDSLQMLGRAVLTGDGTNEWIISKGYVQNGKLFSEGTMHLQTGSFDSAAGSLLGSSHDISISSEGSANSRGSLTANNVAITAANIAGTSTSSIFAKETLRLTGTGGKIGHLGELVAGQELHVTADELDIQGAAFAKRIQLSAKNRATTAGKLYGSETIHIDVSAGSYINNGLAEARNKLAIEAVSFSNAEDGTVSSTEVDVVTSNDVTNAGTITAASKLTMEAGTDVVVEESGSMKAVSVGLKAKNFTNRGSLNVYGFFGNIESDTTNQGTIVSKTYFGLETKNFRNLTDGASITSGDHLFVKASGRINNAAAARITAKSIDLRSAQFLNSGVVNGKDVVNIADQTAEFQNAASGRIYSKVISIVSASSIKNSGTIGQLASASLPRAAKVIISSGDTFENGGQIAAVNVSSVAHKNLLNSGSIKASGGTLFLKSKAGSVTNHGELLARRMRIEAHTRFDNQSKVNAIEDLAIVSAGNIHNRSLNGAMASIAAKKIGLQAASAIYNNGGALSATGTIGLQADGSGVVNNGTISGAAVTMVSRNSGIWSTKNITASDKVQISAQSIGLTGSVRAANLVSLESTKWSVKIEGPVTTKTLLIKSVADIKAAKGVLRGSERVQLIANDIVRTDVQNSSQKLSTISGARGHVYVQLRKGSFGSEGPSVNETAGHSYDTVNWLVSGSVTLISDQGSALLAGQIRAGNNLYVKSNRSTMLGSGSFSAGNVLHLEGRQYLKNHGHARVSAGDTVELVQNWGWFYTKDWLRGKRIGHNFTVRAKTIIVDSDHRFVNSDVFFRASEDIKQWDRVISARKVTYAADRDIFIRFNPFKWRDKNPGTRKTGDFWNVQDAGLWGLTVLSQTGGTHLYAGRDISLRSGKYYSFGNLKFVAGRNFLSEPVYIETGRTNRPAGVGWSFSRRYKGAFIGHDPRKVTIRELRAYENQLRARKNIEISAGVSANFIGTHITADRENISIKAKNGGVNFLAAPGFWTYDFNATTTRRRLLGFYKRRTTYHFDSLEDIYKRASLSAVNGKITVRAIGSNGKYASIISAGTSLAAKDVNISTPNGNVTVGTYSERSISNKSIHSTKRILFIIPFGSRDRRDQHSVLVKYGNEFLADGQLSLAAPTGTLSITGGRIRAHKVNLTAARLEINAAIDSARRNYYSRVDNMITITTIRSGFDRETAKLPEIYSPNIEINVSGETHIQGYRGANLNNQLVKLIGTHKFDEATLGLATPDQLKTAEVSAESIKQKYVRNFDLPGASDGQQFAYLDTLIKDYGATYHTIQLRDHSWYDKQVQLNPAFKALLQAVAAYVTGGITGSLNLGTGLVKAGVDAATTSTIVGVVEGSITGNLDMGQIMRGALLAGVSASISSLINEQVNWGEGLSDQSPFLNKNGTVFSQQAIVDRLGDRVVNQVVSNVVYGKKPFDGFDQLGRTFLVTETMQLAQFGIGELGAGQDAKWEGSAGHALLHGAVGCVAAELLNGDCFAGLASGIGQSVFSGTLKGTNLSDEQQRARAEIIGATIGYLFSGGRTTNVTTAAKIFASGITYNRLLHRIEIEWIQENAGAFRDYMCTAHKLCNLSQAEAITLLRNETLSGVSDSFVNSGFDPARDFIRKNYNGATVVDGQHIFGQLRSSEEYNNSAINIGTVKEYIQFYKGTYTDSAKLLGLPPSIEGVDLAYAYLMNQAMRDLSRYQKSQMVSREDLVDLYINYTVKIGELVALAKLGGEGSNLAQANAENLSSIALYGKLLIDVSVPRKDLQQAYDRLTEAEKGAYGIGVGAYTTEFLFAVAGSGGGQGGRNLKKVLRRIARRAPIKVKAGQLSGATNRPPPPRINVDELPSWERTNIDETIGHVFNGSVPPKKIRQNWGATFRNENGDLPDLGPNGSYREYRVRPQPGTDNSHRMVVGSDGNMYYTWTHYGDAGKPAFVNVGTMTDAQRISVFGK